MTYGFARNGDSFTVRLSAEEAQAVGLVIAQLAGLIQAGSRRGGSGLDLGRLSLQDIGSDVEKGGEPGEDPVIARLFPDGYRNDPEAAAELRGLTESSLREQKVEHASAVLDDLPFEGGEVSLDADAAEAWLLALNDARLMLGTALDIEADTDPLAELDAAAGADPTGARMLGLSLYQFLTGLQASLVDAIDPS